MVTQEPQEPEAGLQLDIFGMTTEIRPKGNGQLVQPTLEQHLLDKIRLQNWNQSTQEWGKEQP